MVRILILGLIVTLEVCECKGHADIRQYTWLEAYKQCRNLNAHLATEATGLSDENKLKLQTSTAWVGKITMLSKWMKSEGCYKIPVNRLILWGGETVADCEWKCRGYRYFASDSMTNRTAKSCLCLTQLPTISPDARNCFNKNAYEFMTVFSRYKQTVQHGKRNSHCLFKQCILPDQIRAPNVTICNIFKQMHGVCGNGTSVPCWILNWKGSLRNCINIYGTSFIDDFIEYCASLKLPALTRLFRQIFTVTLQSTDEIDSTPEKCGTFRYESTKPVIEFVKCNQTLSYLVCALGNATTTVTTFSTHYKKYFTREFASVTGITIGVAVAIIVIVLSILITVLIYKKRESGKGERKNTSYIEV